MAADARITLEGYESLITKLYSDWKDQKEAFCNPRARAIACTDAICSLIFERRTNDAQKLFEECENLGAWDPDIGIDFALINGLKTKKAISTICKNAFNEATQALAFIKS